MLKWDQEREYKFSNFETSGVVCFKLHLELLLLSRVFVSWWAEPLSHSLCDCPPPSCDVTRAHGNAAEVDLAVFTATSDFISGLHHVCVPIRATVEIGAGGAA